MSSNSKNRLAKWNSSALASNIWSTPTHQKIKMGEALIIRDWISRFSIKTVLEVGCGDGFVGKAVLESNESLRLWHFSDLLPVCIAAAKKNVQDDRAKFSLIDAHILDQAYKNNSVECIVSTGFASAATYPEVIPKVASVLKKNGLLMADFVNHLSLNLVPMLGSNLPLYFQKKHYHLGIIGIKDYFAKYKLDLVEYRYSLNPLTGPIICMFKKK